MTLAPGAVQLPFAHLSVRVPWHDTDWTGRVCRAPAENHACAVLKNIKEKKRSEIEQEDAGRGWADLDADRVPPCVLERGGFMRSRGFDYPRKHAYARNAAFEHFEETTQHMPAYSAEATPYRWMRRDESQRYTGTWGIELDQRLEERADELVGFSSDWVQDRTNQLALLDSFFSAFEPGRSLVFFYAKDIPLLEERAPGARVLVGAGLVESVSPWAEWSYKADGPMRSVMWERAVSHSVRPSCAAGFLLPYQRLFADSKLQGTDLSPLVAVTSPDHFDKFSYVSEHVGHDGAIAALTELARVLDLLPDVVEGPWDAASAWIGDRLAEAWHARGPYPGMGPMLVAAGLERGPVIAHRVLEEEGGAAVDPWPALDRAIGMAGTGSGPAAGLVGRTARKAWERLTGDEQRYRLLRLMSRFALTPAQARRLFDGDALGATEALENPYRLFEVDCGVDDSLSFESVDRGLFPADADARGALAADPLPEPVMEAGDGRRVRAATVHVLERAALEGHTLLDDSRLRERLGKLPLTPVCDPPTAVFEDNSIALQLTP